MNVSVKGLLITLSLIGVIIWLFFYSTIIKSPDQSQDTLIVGTNVGYPPFIFRDQNGEVVGFDVGLMRAIETTIDQKIVLQHMSFDALVLALTQKKVDMIIGGIEITPDREREVAWVPYLGQDITTLSLLFWGRPSYDMVDIDDLMKKHDTPTVAVQSGTAQEHYLRSFGDAITVRTLDEVDELILDVRHKKSHAALLETMPALNLQKRHKDIYVITFSVDEPYRPHGVGIGIEKNNRALIQKITHSLEALKNQGVIDELTRHWFGDE